MCPFGEALGLGSRALPGPARPGLTGRAKKEGQRSDSRAVLPSRVRFSRFLTSAVFSDFAILILASV